MAVITNLLRGPMALHKDDTAPLMTADELIEAADLALGGVSPETMSAAQLFDQITVSQYVTETLLAEIERRGMLIRRDGLPVLPYQSDHCVPSALTRRQ